ncbi:MAG TPA: cytochrome C [Gammaproteobacteria bacterium]|nr:cytochrome C [Gammaproteobacteria bacterium]
MVVFTMRLLKLLPLIMLLGVSAQAQSPIYGVGRTPTAEEIRAWDIAISPTGEELPEGSGTADRGSQLYLEKGCAGCHGTTGEGGLAPRLVKRDVGVREDPWDYGRILPIRSPYATTVWDFINRAMPLNAEGTLTPDEVYSITAYLLYLNDVIEDDLMVLDEESLPKIEMPNRDNWAQVPDWFPGQPRLEGYPY